MKNQLRCIAVATAVFLSGVTTSLGQGQIKATSFNETSPSLGRILNTDGVTAINGSGFSVELWGGSSNDRNTFTLVRPKESIALVSGRTFDTGSSTLSGTTGTYFYEMRAWNNASGSITSFDSATTRAISSVASVSLTVAPANPAEASNFSTFQLAAVVVPEPTTMMLGLLGGAALLLRRRKE